MTRAQSDGPFAVDLDEFPLVRILSPNVSTYDHVSISSYFACVDRGLAHGTPFVILHDARDIPHVDDARRTEFMTLLERRRPTIEARVAGYAALVSSPFERGLITAFMWFVKLPMPIRLFSSEAEARRWCLERARAHGSARSTRPPLAVHGA